MMTRYRLTGRIETGELSELYAAIQGNDEPVVIKLFHARNSDTRYAQELAETARLIATLKQPGIVRILELGLVKDRTGDRLAVVRQAVDGLTLGQVLLRLTSKEFILPPPLALAIVIQLLETVQLAHAIGAVHGALTPGNVLLHPAGYPAISDFGALKALQAVPALKKAFGSRGRDAYRAPEVVKGDTPSVESDIYSVGAIAYELLTLREPIGDRAGGTMSTRNGGLPPPSRLDRRLNARLDPIVMRAMELSEARRFRSAGEFASALRNFLANNGGMPNPDELGRFLDQLRGRDSTLTLGPPAFTEPFTLREVRGADLPPVTERNQVVELRPSFSGPRPVLDGPSEPPPEPDATVEAAPGFEEYRESGRSNMITDPGPSRPALSALPKPGMAEPRFDDGTDPGAAGPLERGWDAPSGAPPPKPRNQRGSLPAPPAPGVLSGRPVVRHPRVKFIEDFTSPPTVGAEQFDDKTSLASGGPGSSGPTPAPPPVGASGEKGRKSGEKAPPRNSGPKALLPPPPRDLRAMEITGPLVQQEVSPSSDQLRAMGTAERYLAEDSRRRKRMLVIALSLAFVGAFSFALAIRRYSSKRSTPPEIARADPPPTVPSNSEQPYDPAYQTVNGALQKYFQAGDAKSPAPVSSEPEEKVTSTANAADEDDGFHRSPPKDKAAFFSLTTDVPAIVYIDGLRVPKRSPLVKYPVQPGVRHIAIEAVESGERKRLELAFERGQLKKVDEKFKAPKSRR